MVSRATRDQADPLAPAERRFAAFAPRARGFGANKVNAAQRSCLNRGAVAHHPLARAASAISAAPLARARARGFGEKGLTRLC